MRMLGSVDCRFRAFSSHAPCRTNPEEPDAARRSHRFVGSNNDYLAPWIFIHRYLSVNFRHKDDRILMSRTPGAGVTVSLPPQGSGNAERPMVDVSGIRYRGGPSLTLQERAQDHTTYRFWNGQRFEIRGSKPQLDAVHESIQQQIDASPRGPR